MSWVSPTSFSDPGGTWSNETLAYDGNTTTYAYTSVPKNGWTGYLELYITTINCDKVRGWFTKNIANINNFELDVQYADTSWHNIHTGEPTYGTWVEFPIGSTQSIIGMRFRFYSTKAGSDAGRCHEAEFNEITAPAKTTQYLAGNDLPEFPYEMDFQSDKLPCPPPY